VAWSMTMRLPLTTMLPLPASMEGPVGNAAGSSAQAAGGISAIISARQAGRGVNLNEPLLCLCMPYPGLEAMDHAQAICLGIRTHTRAEDPAGRKIVAGRSAVEYARILHVHLSAARQAVLGAQAEYVGV